MKKILGLAAKARSGKDTAAAILLAHPQVAAYALADPLKAGCKALFALTPEQTWDDTAKEKTLTAWGLSPREFFQLVGTEWMRAHDSLHWLKRADREINGDVLPPSPLSVQQATDPEAPFIQAAQAFFGLSDSQVWDIAQRDVEDAFWSMSVGAMIELVKKLTLRDFPHFEAQRTGHVEISKKQQGKADQEKIQQGKNISAPKLDLENKEVIIIKDIRFENEAEYIRNLNGEIWHVVRHNLEQVKQHSSEAGIEIAEDDIVIENNGSLAEYKHSVESAWDKLIRKIDSQNNNKGSRS
ncbi:deoxynucleotide monophosphate kinase family protein [Pseudomonas sp. SDO55104_S430]